MEKYIKFICAILVVLTIFMISNIVYAVTCDRCSGEGYLYGTSGSSGVKCPSCNGEGEVPEVSNDEGEANKHSIGEIIKEGAAFIQIGQGEESPIKKENIQDLSNTLYNILIIVGIIIAFIIGGILAIQFITGGVGEQVDVKKALIPYILGCIIMFGSFTIWKVIVDVLNEAIEDTENVQDAYLEGESTSDDTGTEQQGDTQQGDTQQGGTQQGGTQQDEIQNGGTNSGTSQDPGGQNSSQTPQETKIKLDKTTLKLEKKGTYTLKATVTPAGTKISWSSSDTSVATVTKNGKVKAKEKVGVVTITAKTEDGKAKATCTVTVKPTSLKAEHVISMSMQAGNGYASCKAVQSLACDGKNFYVFQNIDDNNSRIIKIDMKTNQIVQASEVMGGLGHGNGMTYKDGLLYIVDGKKVYRIDAKTLKQKDTKKIKNESYRITYNEKTKKFYTMSSKYIYVYDKNLNCQSKIKLSQSFSGSGQDIEYDGNNFYVLTWEEDSNSSYLYQYDNNGKFIAKIKYYNDELSEFEGITMYNNQCYVLQNIWKDFSMKISKFTLK